MSDGRYQSSRDDGRRDRDGDRGDRRRRSRSPRGDRRRGDVDSYSNSRSYREREREDSYRGGGRDRDRRDDRGWGGDRDRGSARRDARRDDDRRAPPRGDRRDLMDDRRAPRDGDRRDDRGDRMRDQDDMRQLERSARSDRTPPPKAREPTPDLTDVVSVRERKRRLTQWDHKPQGYEGVTAEQAKLSGMFPLPGAPRQQAIDPARLATLTQQPGGSANNSILQPANARQSKRLFIHNLPESANNEYIQDFFNLQLNGTNVTKEQDPCSKASISTDKTYALLEFRSSEDATHAMALDGISMDAGANMNGDGAAAPGLEIKRPRDYIVPAVTDESNNTNPDHVPDTQNKISITNIPAFIDEDQVKELLEPFGTLKNFVLVKDTSSGTSRGIVFAEYENAKEATDIAIGGINGLELGEKPLKVQRASIGIHQGPAEMSVGAMSLMATTNSSTDGNSRVIKLMNLVLGAELLDDDEADEIEEDIRDECSKFGPIVSLKMPRPAGSRINNGVGKVFVKYEQPEQAKKALTALAGRKFAERTVVATFFGEEYFDTEAW